MQATILPLQTPLTPGWGQKVEKKILCWISNLRERNVEQNASKKLDLAHTPDLWSWVERSDIEIVQRSIFLFN